MEERTEWRRQSENQIGGEEKWQTCRRCRDQQRARRMPQASAEKLEHTGPAEKERVASVPKREREQLANAPEPPFAKKERNRDVCPEHQIVKRAFSVRELKRAAAEERERDEYFSAEGQ